MSITQHFRINTKDLDEVRDLQEMVREVMRVPVADVIRDAISAGLPIIRERYTKMLEAAQQVSPATRRMRTVKTTTT